VTNLRQHTVRLSSALTAEREAISRLRNELRGVQYKLKAVEHDPDIPLAERATERSRSNRELNRRHAELRQWVARCDSLGKQLGDASDLLRGAVAAADAAASVLRKTSRAERRQHGGTMRLDGGTMPPDEGTMPKDGGTMPPTASPHSHDIPAAVRAAFLTADRDGSGSISVRELKPALRGLGLAASSGEAIALLAHFDQDGDGSLNLGEFVALWRKLHDFEKGMAPAGGAVAAEAQGARAQGGAAQAGVEITKQVRAAFELFDQDGSGSLGTREVRSALSKLGVDASNAEAIAALQRFDADGDGSLGLKEFAVLVAEPLRFQAAPAPVEITREVGTSSV
jgi:calmodulin